MFLCKQEASAEPFCKKSAGSMGELSTPRRVSGKGHLGPKKENKLPAVIIHSQGGPCPTGLMPSVTAHNLPHGLGLQALKTPKDKREFGELFRQLRRENSLQIQITLPGQSGLN